MIAILRSLFRAKSEGAVGPPPVAEQPVVAFIPPPVNASLDEARVLVVGPMIAIVNLTSLLADAEVATVVSALQVQISRDFAPAWNINANLVAVARGASAPLGSWVITLLDDSEQAEALNYHDLTVDRLPLGKVFVKDDLKYGVSWTVTLSHELCELLVDPYIQNTVFVQRTSLSGTLYALDVCDPVEADDSGYQINGVQVSNFVYPAWFETFRPAHSSPFDHMRRLTSPLQVAPGGYVGLFTVPSSSGWTLQAGPHGLGTRAASRGFYSRMHRRARREQPFLN